MNFTKKAMSFALATVMTVTSLSCVGITAFAREEAKISGAALNLKQAVAVTENDRLYSENIIPINYIVEKQTAEYAGEFGSYYDAASDSDVNYTTKDVIKKRGIGDVYSYYYITSILNDNKSTVTLSYSDGTTSVVSLSDYDNLDVVDAAGNVIKSNVTYSTDKWNADNDKYNIKKSNSVLEFDYQGIYVFNGVTYDYSFKAGNTYNLKLSYGKVWNEAKQEYDYSASVVVPFTVNHAATKTVNAKTATYWAKGYTGDKVCTDCGAIITAGKSISKKKATLSSVKSTAKKSIKATCKKISGATGYQVQYSTSSKFTKSTTKSVSGKSTSKTIKKLKSGKKYYVRVRAYKTVSGVKTYTSYSSAKSVKAK